MTADCVLRVRDARLAKFLVSQRAKPANAQGYIDMMVPIELRRFIVLRWPIFTGAWTKRPNDPPREAA
jgi:hypothetical protein